MILGCVRGVVATFAAPTVRAEAGLPGSRGRRTGVCSSLIHGHRSLMEHHAIRSTRLIASPSMTSVGSYSDGPTALRALALIACVVGSLALTECSESRTLPIGLVLTDPRDGRHLIVNVGTCSQGGAVTAEEQVDEVVLSVTGERSEPPCTPNSSTCDSMRRWVTASSPMHQQATW